MALGQCHCMHSGSGAAEPLGLLDCPVLVIHGSDDALSPVSNGEALVDQFPNASFQLMEGIGHSPNVEDAHGFNQAIEDFLAQG